MDRMSAVPAKPATEGDVLRDAVAVLRRRLPPGWSLVESLDAGLGARRADAVLLLQDPSGAAATFVVEAKRILESRDVPAVRERVATLVDVVPGSTGMVVARYLAEPVRERLADAGLSYVDASGNVLVRAQSPGLYIADRGADRDPWRGPGRPKGTLKGEPAAKVVRWLTDTAGPWRIRELVDYSLASTGSVYRVVEFLEGEGLLSRDAGGRIEVPDWTALLRRWSEDYQFVRTNTVTRWIAVRGLDDFLTRVREADEPEYAVTGSVAASAWAPYAPARSAMVYVTNAERAAQAWGLRAADAGVNVLLAEPAYPVLLERPVEALDGLMLAAPTQVAVDLMTGPGRSPAEAEELLDWMRRNEDSWRK